MTPRPRIAALRMATRLADLVVLSATFAGVLAARLALGRNGFVDLPGIDVDSYIGLLVLLLPAWWGALEITGSYRRLRRMSFLSLLSMVLRATALATLAVVIVLYALHLRGQGTLGPSGDWTRGGGAARSTPWFSGSRPPAGAVRADTCVE